MPSCVTHWRFILNSSKHSYAWPDSSTNIQGSKEILPPSPDGIVAVGKVTHIFSQTRRSLNCETLGGATVGCYKPTHSQPIKPTHSCKKQSSRLLFTSHSKALNYSPWTRKTFPKQPASNKTFKRIFVQKDKERLKGISTWWNIVLRTGGKLERVHRRVFLCTPCNQPGTAIISQLWTLNH